MRKDDDLDFRSADLRVQESFINAHAARKQKDKPVSAATQAQVRFWEKIGEYYQKLVKDEGGDRREALCDAIGCSREDLSKGKFCRLPEFPGGSLPARWISAENAEGKKELRLRTPEDGQPRSWKSRQEVSATEFTTFLTDMAGLGKTTLNDKVYKTSRRPERESVEKLCEGLPVHNKAQLYMLLGHYLQTEAGELPQMLKRTNWPGASDEEIGIYLGMSKNMYYELQTRLVHYSNALRINIVLGHPQGTAEEETLYHFLGVHRLPQGEGDDLVYVCQEIYAGVMPVRRSLYGKYGSAEEFASEDFWRSLYTLLKHFDSGYYPDSKGYYRKCSLKGQLFYTGPQTLDLTDAKKIMEA